MVQVFDKRSEVHYQRKATLVVAVADVGGKGKLMIILPESSLYLSLFKVVAYSGRNHGGIRPLLMS